MSGQDNQIECEAKSVGETEPGYKIGSRAIEERTSLTFNESSLILEQYPWTAKGDKYLSYSRRKKARILRKKVLEDSTVGPNEFLNVFNINLNEVFDITGDELECRFKTSHPHGAVGEIKWISYDNHPYTGMFKGGAGFIRMSDFMVPFEDPSVDPRNIWSWPSIAVKLFRDGMESGNSTANVDGNVG